MRKLLPLLVVGILVLGGLGAVAVNTDKEIKSKNTVLNSLDDELDQSQTVMTENLTLPIGQIILDGSPYNIQLAQSFIPTKEVITRIELYIGKNITVTRNLTVSIRKELTEDDLVSIEVLPEDVPTQEFDWVEMDIKNTRLTPGQTYYIVALTTNVTDNYYAWCGNADPESYLFGCLWYSLDEGNTWGNESTNSQTGYIEEWLSQHQNPTFEDDATWDMCFKTYGRENMAPGAPTITGPSGGKPKTSYDFIFNAVDPDNDNVKYLIDWSDGTTDTTDFNPSGIDVKVSHKWTAKGTYVIKAKAQDIDGLIGLETTKTVTMPRYRAINSQLTKLLISYMKVSPILQKIFGL